MSATFTVVAGAVFAALLATRLSARSCGVDRRGACGGTDGTWSWDGGPTSDSGTGDAGPAHHGSAHHGSGHHATSGHDGWSGSSDGGWSWGSSDGGSSWDGSSGSDSGSSWS